MDYLFSKPSFNCVGDPYVDPGPNPFEHGTLLKGRRQFQTAPPKKNQTIGSYVPASIPGKDVYQDSYVIKAKYRKEGHRKFLTPAGFSYSSPMKKSSSPGDAQGTFQGRVAHVPMGKPRVEKTVNHHTTRPRLLVVPSKAGGPGVSGTLIGGQNVEYVSSDYDALKTKLKCEAKEHRMRVGGRRPFTAATRRTRFFDEKVYTDDRRATAVRRSSTPASHSGNAYHFFRPAGPAKNGYNSTLSPFPESVPEQFDDKARRRAFVPLRRLPLTESCKYLPPHLKDRKPFRPASGPRSSTTRPISTMGLRI